MKVRCRKGVTKNENIFNFFALLSFFYINYIKNDPSHYLRCLFPAASLRAELNHLHATAIEHLKQIHLKEHAATKRELEKAMEHSQKQVTLTVV